MNNPELERWVSRAFIPAYVVLAAIGASAWTLGTWLARLSAPSDSTLWVLVAGIAWILIVLGQAITISMAILITLLGLHWAINTAEVRRSRGDRSAPQDTWVLTYSWPYKILSYTAFAFAVFCAGLFLPDPEQHNFGIGSVVVFTVGGLIAFFNLNLRRIRVSPDGLEITQPFRSRQFPWTSIRNAHVKDEYLVLQPKGSPSARVSTSMRNIEQLLVELERRRLLLFDA